MGIKPCFEHLHRFILTDSIVEKTVHIPPISMPLTRLKQLTIKKCTKVKIEQNSM